MTPLLSSKKQKGEESMKNTEIKELYHKLIAQHGKDAAPYVGAFVKEMKDAIR